MLKTWNMWLIFSTFMLSIFGTFLTAQRVVSSVHAFAHLQSVIGRAFLAIIFATCLFFYVKNRSHLRTEHKLESLVSRDPVFLFNNLLLLVACFTVLWGDAVPRAHPSGCRELKLQSDRHSLNRVNIPVALLLLL